MNETEEFWRGEFGDSYIARNRVDWRKRRDFWSKILSMTGARSVFEVGCNAGWNMTAIQNAVYWKPEVYGCDVNVRAAEQAEAAGFPIYIGSLVEDQIPCELVFTSGVLIHIPPEEITTMMQKIIDASSDYVLAIEYESEHEQEVEYRGHSGKLWKRPYGNMYELMGLTLIDNGELTKADGFDDCQWWLFWKSDNAVNAPK